MRPVHALLEPAKSFLRIYLDELLELEPDMVRRAPCLGYGRGGVAYALLRSSTIGGRHDVLPAAARWASAGIRSAHPFRLAGWPKASYSRGLAGLYAITAMIARARGDDATRDKAITRFVEVNRSARGSIELFQGAAGRLAGTAILYRQIPDPRLRDLGDHLADQLVRALRQRTARLAPTGVAHGWSGVVLGLLQWERVTDDVIAEQLRTITPAAEGPGWAHGHAGIALLFARAFRRLGDRRHLDAARTAGEQAYVTVDDLSLVKGATGIAYSMLALAEIDPSGPWRQRLHQIVNRALATLEVPDKDPYGVWGGLSGLYCLLTDLVHDVPSAFPGIEA